MNNDFTTLQAVPLFRDLSNQELEYIKDLTIQRFFRKKQIIFTEGSEKAAVFFICDGLVKAYKTDENGHEQIVSFLKKGEMFPHIGLFNMDPYPATAEAIVDTHLLAIPVRSFEQLLLEKPIIAIKVMRVLGAKIKELQEQIQGLTGQDVYHRFLSFLEKIAQKHGEIKENTVHIQLPMTHLEIANTIGTTRESINRLFSQLRKENIIETDRSGIIILNISELHKWSQLS